MPDSHAVDLKAIEQAQARIAGHVHRTPVVTCQSIDRVAGCQVFFKCENLQKVGAFKFRGATNAVLSLDAEQAASGVVTHSSGNHAQAVALAAAQRGVPAHIVMPTSAPAVKRAAVEGYGARVISCEPTLEARETTAAKVQEETGAQFIHPYDDPRVIAGQGTVALELIDQVPGLDVIVTPVGGGGLLSGTLLACAASDTPIRVLAGEPAGADDAARSLAAGEWIPQTNPSTVADGLLTSTGRLTWPIIRDLVEDIVVVDDDAIVDAMKLIWQRAKLVVEASGAVPLAAVLHPSFPEKHNKMRIGVVLSGGNVDLENLPWMKAEQ